MARRLGIMGGTFDPVHLGHLVTAEQARVDVGLDEVVFIPAGMPWQKAARPVSAAEHRYLMTVLGTANNDRFSVSRMEIDREGPSYTVDTLRAIRRRFPEVELFFITGADAILNILTWEGASEALSLASFVAATRPGYDLTPLDDHHLTEKVQLLDVPALAISSSDVRERFAAGRAVRYLIPHAVEAFVRKHGMYGTGGAGLLDDEGWEF